MTLTSVSQNYIGANVQISSGLPGDSYLIEEDVLFWNTGGLTAIHLTGSDHELVVEGSVISEEWAVLFETLAAGGFGHKLHVTSTGSLYGAGHGAGIYGSATVVNEGELRGGFRGIQFNLDGAPSTITNSGVISGGWTGILVYGLAGEQLQVTNSGHIEGGEQAYYGDLNIDLFTNSGTMVGTVLLEDGNDIFDNRLGTVEGLIDGGGGDDRFLPGLSVETIEGGNGLDTLDFRSGPGLRVSLLDGSLNTGRAAGDTYTGIDNVWGSAKGNDTLIGDGQANELKGYGGVDTLKGGDGADRLEGGAGADRLTGGWGDDTLVFASLAQAGDKVSGFGSVLENDDRFEIDASGFGVGSVAEGMLDASAFLATANSNAAGDAGDRFIFRDSDDTLWFDRDGTGSTHTSKLVADLQAGASVSAGDIWLV